VPLALKQQHSFALVSNMSTLEAEVAEMHDKRTCLSVSWAVVLAAVLAAVLTGSCNLSGGDGTSGLPDGRRF